MTFSNYTDALLSALLFNPKMDDVIAKKQEILDGVYRTENLEPTSILFVGFNPAILSCTAKNIAVTEISDTAREFLTQRGIKYTYISPEELVNYKKQFQVVVAMDEYFTFANSDADQRTLIAGICGLATAFVISTVRDYKNQDFKDRDFSAPIMIRHGADQKLFVEAHDWDIKDRTHWVTTVYEINKDQSLVTYGAFERRTMFFKQLAKFSMDAGAVNFLVHKNLMYKSLIKKNYEHVISIQFE
jgi:dihydrodipicolinate synthase/N-acetylneuraminate lyase